VTDLNVNDFSIHVASANGTGSASSNLALLRGFVNMGIPAVAKNLFPSNIQGLPTWYNLRVTKDDFRARKEGVEILICMNQISVQNDLTKVSPGAVCFVRDKLKYQCDRDDIEIIEFPADKIVKEACAVTKLRKLVINFTYVGVVAEYLGMDHAAIEKGLDYIFAGKEKAIALNMAALDASAAWAKENLPEDRKFRVEPMDLAQNRILLEGNAATALGALFAGCTVLGWYPITPATSVCEDMIKYANRYKLDEHGKSTFASVQAEDELASIGVVLGASWAGARAMTSTSGPGISLMSEFIGLGYFTELPAVLINVQRMGPSTGLPTRTSQGDVFSTYFLSHGDARHVLLFPASPEEAFELTGTAFDLADELQTPVFVMSDLDLGMNTWMSSDFKYPSAPLKRGKVLHAEDLAKLDHFGRYEDVDGDGIAYRTFPGNSDPKAPWFSRGTGHSPMATYSEDPDNYRELMDRLGKKFETARKMVPPPVIHGSGHKIGVIAFGTTDGAVEEARILMERHHHPFDYMRIRALPMDVGILRDFVESHEKVYVVEQNKDRQMAQILQLEVPDLAHKFHGVNRYDGFPMCAQEILAGIPEIEGMEV
jgi:2-oxoglutarate ferredoxin oxidoreductase subunit alpha